MTSTHTAATCPPAAHNPDHAETPAEFEVGELIDILGESCVTGGAAGLPARETMAAIRLYLTPDDAAEAAAEAEVRELVDLIRISRAEQRSHRQTMEAVRTHLSRHADEAAS